MCLDPVATTIALATLLGLLSAVVKWLFEGRTLFEIVCDDSYVLVADGIYLY
jgi:hypothetical protein